MTRIALSTVALLALVLPAAAQGTKTNAAFHQMLAETGCKSKSSDEKKADKFAQNWSGKSMTVTGEIASADKGSVSLKILRDTLTMDVMVDMENPKDTYDMEEGQRMTMTFTVSGHGGCFLPYIGKGAVLATTGF